jgi:hypothetical protein
MRTLRSSIINLETHGQWQASHLRGTARIETRLENCDFSDENDWHRQFDWLVAHLDLFNTAFRPIVRDLWSGCKGYPVSDGTDDPPMFDARSTMSFTDSSLDGPETIVDACVARDVRWG